MRKKRSFFYLFVLNIVFAISIGFALLNKNLSITGTSNIEKTVWDIHFTNLYVVDGSVSSNGIPSISDEEFSVLFSVSLDKPGDFYEFTVDVINYGTIDAMIDSIVKTPELTDAQKKYLNYIIEYENGELIVSKQTVSKFDYVRLKVRVEYKMDITAADLPTVTETLNLGFSINYVQADSTAISIKDNGIISKEGYSSLLVFDKEWVEVPGITLYDSINLQYLKAGSITSYPRIVSDYNVTNGDIQHILINEDGKVYNLKNTRVEADMTYFSTWYSFGAKITNEKLDNEDYVTIILDVSGIFSEFGEVTEAQIIPVIMDDSDTYVNVAHSIFPLGLYFADASTIEGYEQELIGEYVLGFPSGQNSGCGSNTIHRFFLFVDENQQLKKLSDTVKQFDTYSAGILTVEDSEMTFDEAKEMILQMIQEYGEEEE